MRHIVFVLLLFSISASAQETNELSIYFANDSDKIVKSQMFKIDSLKHVHQRDSIRLILKGYTNELASNEYNLKLAQRRLVSVVSKLSQFPIDTIQAIGELSNTSWKARRVDIFVNLQEKNIPDSTQYAVIETKIEGNKRRMLSSRNLDITSYSELEVYETTVLFGVFFQGGTDRMLGSSSIVTLRKVVRFLEGYPTRRILITGHICCSPDRDPEIDGFNNRTGSTTLSLDRGKVVYEYLIKNGISPDRLKYVGKAYRVPLDWEEIKNRRVEMTILE